MKLSIITINYNNAQQLEKTISSVVAQTWKAFEYIIIDGGSTDESVEIIKQNEHQIDYWISEKDKGIFHAMNKGIAIANGEYLLMLNSGDVLADTDILQNIFKKNNYAEDILYGDVQWLSKGISTRKSEFPNQLSFRFFWNKSLGHQAAFIKKKVHESAGLYDENLKFCADWKLFVLAICKYNCSYKHLNIIVSFCDGDGVSWHSANLPFMKAEQQQVLKKEFPIFYNDYAELEKIETNTFKQKTKNLKTGIKQKLKKMIGYKKRKSE